MFAILFDQLIYVQDNLILFQNLFTKQTLPKKYLLP